MGKNRNNRNTFAIKNIVQKAEKKAREKLEMVQVVKKKAQAPKKHHGGCGVHSFHRFLHINAPKAAKEL